MGNRRRILYLSFNDGSDSRINKEVESLISAGAEIDFVALGTNADCCFLAKPALRKFFFIKGPRLAPLTLLKYFMLCGQLLVLNRYHSVHLINEPQLIVLWPFLWFQKRVVVDLFDSIFLKKNHPGNDLALLKNLIYKPAKVLVVTDEARFRLSTDNVKRKTVILPNYPRPFRAKVETSFDSKCLTILYCGALSTKRGTNLLFKLINTGKRIRILMAGWIADQVTFQLAMNPHVEWFGVLKQDQMLSLAAARADFLLCVYEPDTVNNRYASPNKVYDGIQTEKPVIINQEIHVSDFVQMNRIGYVIPSSQPENYESLYDELVAFKKNFIPNRDLKKNLTWFAVEDCFLKAHGLSRQPAPMEVMS